MTQQQKIAASMMGALLVVALGAFAFLGGYVVRQRTEPAPAVVAAAQVASPSQASAPTTQGSSQKSTASDGYGVLQEIQDVLKQHYVDPSRLDDARGLRQGAIDGLLNTVGDTHQVYVRPEDIQFEESDLSGQFEGIGATVQQKNGEVSIENFIPDYPASKSNLKVGDVILSVDGQSMKGKTSTDVVKAIRGRAGTEVKINVRHPDGKTEDVSLVRAQIRIDSVHVDDIVDRNGQKVTDLAYLRISQFQQTTDKEVADYLKSIQGKGYKGLILDLRNNPGGYLAQTENILNDFLKPGQTELITQGRGGTEQVDKAKNGAASTDLPVVVLVNKNSASASEITAGALRDNKRGIVMGEKSFGKGTVNQFYPLPKDGGEIYVTVARWLTPNRDQIEGTGITPDVTVHLGDNDDVRGYTNEQLFTAIDTLRKGN